AAARDARDRRDALALEEPHRQLRAGRFLHWELSFRMFPAGSGSKQGPKKTKPPLGLRAGRGWKRVERSPLGRDGLYDRYDDDNDDHGDVGSEQLVGVCGVHWG